MNELQRDKPCSYRQARGQGLVTSRLTTLLVVLVAFKGIACSQTMIGVLLGETAEIPLPNCHRYTLYDPRGRKVVSLHRYGNHLYANRADEVQTEHGDFVLLLKNVIMADSGDYVLRPDARATLQSGCDRTYFLNVSRPVPSAWGSWGAWQPCSVTCGNGYALRRRPCIHGNLDDTCTGRDSAVGPCYIDCSIDGGWSSWDHWTDCTVSCGGGIRNRHRTCNNPEPNFGGKACDGSDEDDGRCGITPCPVDGKWSSWDHWTDCTVTCGGGTRNRHRTCNNPEPNFGGKACDGSDEEDGICGTTPCPIDGKWSSWDDWTDCTVTCGGGTRNRHRTCNNPEPNFGGKACDGSDEEDGICGTTPCPIDGGWSSWDHWADCTVTCGGGTRNRYRTCNSPKPRFGGKRCDGPNEEGGQCASLPCPIDGGWSSWDHWTDCTVTCSGGIRFRHRKCDNPATNFGGKSCAGLNEEDGPCGADSCPIDGGWSSWNHWADCSVTCGGGIRNRNRTCDNPKHDFGGRPCNGPNEEDGPCGTFLCPIDGGWSSWDHWADCAVTCGGGIRSRHRTCNSPKPRFGGKPCNGLDEEDGRCEKLPCPLHGGWSSWDHWTDCTVSCGGGTRKRHRTCNSPKPLFGGKPCFGLDEEDGPCGKSSCPIDGGWSSWDHWADCSVTCGGGIRIRKRTCDNPEHDFGGRHCEGPDEEDNPCGTTTCSIHGGWGTWGNWSECQGLCGDVGMQERYRSCDKPVPMYGGEDCHGNSTENEICLMTECPPPVSLEETTFLNKRGPWVMLGVGTAVIIIIVLATVIVAMVRRQRYEEPTASSSSSGVIPLTNNRASVQRQQGLDSHVCSSLLGVVGTEPVPPDSKRHSECLKSEEAKRVENVYSSGEDMKAAVKDLEKDCI